jgi:hypothetical protein
MEHYMLANFKIGFLAVLLIISLTRKVARDKHSSLAKCLSVRARAYPSGELHAAQL